MSAWRRIRRIAPIVVLFALAVFAALVARDAAAVRHSMERGDVTFLEGKPVYDQLWLMDTTTPFATELFGVEDDLLYRHALRKYAAEERRAMGRVTFSGPGLRAEAQAALNIAEHSDLSPRRKATLATLQGILAWEEQLTSPLEASGLAIQSLQHIQRAVKTDPSHVDAKYSLEYIMRHVDPNSSPQRQRQFVPADIEARSTPGGGGDRRGQGY